MLQISRKYSKDMLMITFLNISLYFDLQILEICVVKMY